jgi:lysyl-tRNA synthetase class 2
MQRHDPEGAPETSPQREEDDFRPTAALEMLRRRALLLRAVREFFDERGYFEVETPLLSQDVCVDAWLDPFIVPLSPTASGASRPETWYLQTSPEFGMKRLLAAGARAIYQITRSFRRGERGARHNPEFTILEWYRAGDTPDDQMQLVEELVRRVAEAAALPGGGPRSESPFRRLAYDDAFAQFAGTRVLHLAPRELEELARARRVPVPESLDGTDRDAWLNLLLAELVEPKLAGEGAVFLYDYPHTQAALSNVRPGAPPVAERFELYLDGIEICNGYHELTDADELAARMRRQGEMRRAAGLSELPVESRLLRAMRAGLPACTGVALGFDRLALWALGQERLADVMAFPFDRA